MTGSLITRKELIEDVQRMKDRLARIESMARDGSLLGALEQAEEFREELHGFGFRVCAALDVETRTALLGFTTRDMLADHLADEEAREELVADLVGDDETVIDALDLIEDVALEDIPAEVAG